MNLERRPPFSGTVLLMPHPLLSDLWIAAKIDAAVQKHGKRWTPEQIEHFREQMAWTLATHPRVTPVLELARPGQVDQSGTRAKGGEVESPGNTEVLPKGGMGGVS